MSLWVMAKILATSELEAKESGIFLHFLIFMVFSMLIFSELVRCPDMDHKIPFLVLRSNSFLPEMGFCHPKKEIFVFLAAKKGNLLFWQPKKEIIFFGAQKRKIFFFGA